MSVTKEQAAALYAAVFNRAPDQAGLNYWIEQESFNVMAESFVAHPVFTEQYGDLDNQAFVEAIYENVLLGQGDAEGIEFWVGALDAGLSRGEFLASFIDASLNYEGDDAEALLRKDALVNKVTVGLYYTDTFGEATNFPADADIGSADIVNSPVYQKAAAAIENVTADPETVEAAKAEIDREVESNELVNALETYQAALVAQTEADKAAAEALEAAKKVVDENEGDEDIADTVARLEGEALEIAFEGNASSLELNDATIQLARDKFTNTINLAQAEVDVLKAQNKAAVNLQEKIEAYNTVAKEINATVTAFNAEAAKFAALNKVESAPEATFADQKLVDLKVTVPAAEEGEEAVEYTLAVKSGKVVAVDEDGKTDAEATAKFNELDGADAFAAQLVALNANTAKQANAQKAIEAATLQALKDAGYKVFDEKGNVVAWSKVKFNAAGELVAAAGEEDTTAYQVKTAKDAEDNIFKEPLFAVDGIGDDGIIKLDPDAGERKDFAAINPSGMPPVIADAAENSAEAVGTLSDIKEESAKFEAALKEYNDAVALQTALTEADAAAEAAGEAVEAAAEAFAGLGYHLVVAEGTVATGELITNADEDPNLFVYNTDLTKVDNFSGDDLFFFGDKAAALVVVADDAEKLGGDNSVLEIFAQQEGENTILYVEKAAFAGGSSTPYVNENGDLVNKDLVKITLTGVQADELVFENGFLQF